MSTDEVDEGVGTGGCGVGVKFIVLAVGCVGVVGKEATVDLYNPRG